MRRNKIRLCFWRFRSNGEHCIAKAAFMMLRMKMVAAIRNTMNSFFMMHRMNLNYNGWQKEREKKENSNG